MGHPMDSHIQFDLEPILSNDILLLRHYYIGYLIVVPTMGYSRPYETSQYNPIIYHIDNQPNIAKQTTNRALSHGPDV